MLLLIPGPLQINFKLLLQTIQWHLILLFSDIAEKQNCQILSSFQITSTPISPSLLPTPSHWLPDSPLLVYRRKLHLWRGFPAYQLCEIPPFINSIFFVLSIHLSHNFPPHWLYLFLSKWQDIVRGTQLLHRQLPIPCKGLQLFWVDIVSFLEINQVILLSKRRSLIVVHGLWSLQTWIWAPSATIL